jgi:hypothetical protein
MKVKDLGLAANKFATNAASGANNYATGVRNNQNWASRTEAAAGTWAQGVQAAAANGRFAKNVAKAGQSKWQQSSVDKGQSRFQSAVTSASAKQNWQTGFSPYAAAINSIPDAPKGVRGSPQNYQIVQQIGDTLHKLKQGS